MKYFQKLPYQILAIVTAIMGVACAFYLPVIELVAEVDVLVTVQSTELFTLLELRSQMVERGMDVLIINISILLLVSGSIINIISIAKTRLLLPGSVIQLLSFVILYYDTIDQNQKNVVESILSEALEIRPTMWVYVLVGSVFLSVVLTAVREVLQLVATDRNEQ